METIYIGDIHGRNSWKQIVKDHSNIDNIVFVGDYFDSYNISGIDQLNNIKDIVDFKKQQELNPEQKVYLLIGNHDHHYWPGVLDRGGTSGFQPTMAFQFEQFFRENESMFQMSVLIGNRLCTHAGVSSRFLDEVGFWKSNDDESQIADWLNDLFKYKPNEFLFIAGFHRTKSMERSSHYGDNTFQSPIWIRPESLQRVNKKTDLKNDYIQIVGHTQQNTIDIKGKSTGGRYYYIDTLEKGQYLIDIDGEFKLGYCNTDT